MADVFDEVAAQPQAKTDIFDQVAAEKPWIGQPRPENEGMLSSLYHLPAYGVQDIGTGIKHLTQEGKRRQGAHEVFTGAGEAAFPAVVAGGAAALPALGGAGLLPYLGTLATSAGLGTAGAGLGYGASALAGADPETSQLVGDATGLAGAGLGGLPRTQAAAKAGLKEAFANATPELLRKLSFFHPLASIPDALNAAGKVGSATAEGWRSFGMEPPPGWLQQSSEAFDASKKGALAKQLRKFTPGSEDYSPPSKPVRPNTVTVSTAIPASAAETPAVFDEIAKGLAGRKYENLTPEQQSTVRSVAMKMPAPPGTLPTPGSFSQFKVGQDVTVNTGMGSSLSNLKGKIVRFVPDPMVSGQEVPILKLPTGQEWPAAELSRPINGGSMPSVPGMLPTPQAGVIPEGEHAIIRRVAEVNRGNKDVAIARSLKDEGISGEALDKLSDADLQKRVRDLGYRPSTGKNYSRTWEAFRRDLRKLVD